MKIEGKNAIMEAIRGELTIDALLVERGANHQIIAMARERGAKVQFVDKFVLDKESETGKHQGFIAKVSNFVYSDIDEILAVAEQRGEKPLIVILDGIEDPHNLGSILRTSECAGAHGVIIGKNRSVSVNETVVKVSAGASAHMRVARVTNLTTAINELKERGLWIYCADSEGDDLYAEDFAAPTALIIGNEGRGASRLVRENSDKIIGLKMRGQISSLNASVACGVLLFEIARKLFKAGK